MSLCCDWKKKACFLQGDPGEKGSKGEIGLTGPKGLAGPKVSLFFHGNPSLCILLKNLWSLCNVKISHA